MCGIAGFLGRADSAAAARNVQLMTERLMHRGPDHWAVEVEHAGNDGVIAFGHTRLAIIDIAGGNQPFRSDDGRFTLIYNGEVYNYLETRAELEAMGVRFRSRSDTEVVLQACIRWGTEALSKFRGMFAFALWDSKEQSLLLARDHFGEKPLFYHQDGRGFAFASELPALLAHPDVSPELNTEALADYLVFKYVPGSASLVRGVKQLRPGHYAILQGGKLTETSYYCPPLLDHARKDGRPYEDLVSDFREELTASVRLRMRSDVEVGAYLSGGIDSSAIVALMSQETHRKVKTFSVGFNEQGFDELWAARMVADHIGTDHHEIVIGPQHYVDHFEHATWHRGAPLSELADVPLFCLSRLASRHVKVVLSGEGADELLGGYPKHWGERYVTRYHRFSTSSVDKLGAKLGRRVAPGNHRVESLMRAVVERDFINRQAAWFGSVSRSEINQLAPGLTAAGAGLNVWLEDPGAGAGHLARALLFDQMIWLPGTLLARGDRMLMASSVEGRIPFLDTKLAEFISHLPAKALIKGRVGKRILRHAVAPLLPMKIIERPKHGFRVPFADWLRRDLRSFAHDTLLDSKSQARAMLEAGSLEKLLAQHDSGERDRAREIWSLLSLEVFLGQLAKGFDRGVGQNTASEPVGATRAMASC